MCGETGSWNGLQRIQHGRSPRVRGNLPPLTLQEGGQRSIPACAGKPLLHQLSMHRLQVDPRVCGETQPVDQPQR